MPTLFRLKVHAAATRDRIEPRGEGAYEAWVRAPAEAGRANAAALSLLAAAVGVEARKLRVVKGARRPAKIIAVLGT